MLRCLGVKATYASWLCGDNLGVIKNCTISSSLLKKKHVAIAYHKTRECAAAGVVRPAKVLTEDNFADLLTKALKNKAFDKLIDGMTLN